MLLCAVCENDYDTDQLEFTVARVNIFSPDDPTHIILGTCHECEPRLSDNQSVDECVRGFISDVGRCAYSEPAYAFGILSEEEAAVALKFAESCFSGITELLLLQSSMYTKELFRQMKNGKNLKAAHESAAQILSEAAEA